MKFLAGTVVLLSLAVSAIGSVAFSGASFTATSSNPGNRVSAAADWTGPTVSLTNPGTPLRGTVALTATASDAIGTVAGVRIQRSPAGAATWTDICTDSTSPFGCSWDTTAAADGSYDLRAIATDNSGNATTSALVTARIVDNNAPTVSLTDPGSYVRGTFTLPASATDAGTGVASVAIQRSPSGTATWTTICTTTSSPYSCSLNTKAGATPDGDYDFRAVATDNAGNSATDIVGATIDNTAPTAALTAPGSPRRGVVTFTAAPSDSGSSASGASDITVQVSAAGSGNWSTACTASNSPWSCAWDSTTVAGASYDFRVVVNDLAGNSGTSATVTRTVDNSVSSVFMNDPGSYLRGTVNLQATVSNPGATPSVRIQISAAGANSWTTVCTVTATPWTCPLDTSTKLDGSYDFRAILTDATGTKTSNTVTSRIDNSLLRGTDIQSANKTGGAVGRVEAGDVLTFTYSTTVAPSSLAAGWDGTSALPVYLRLRDGALVGLTGRSDTIDLFTDSTLKTAVSLGSVNTRTDLVKANKTSVFNATLTRTGSASTTFTVTVGALVSGGALRTSADLIAMVWTPSSSATDPTGSKSSTAPVTQSGTAHVNF